MPPSGAMAPWRDLAVALVGAPDAPALLARTQQRWQVTDTTEYDAVETWLVRVLARDARTVIAARGGEPADADRHVAVVLVDADVSLLEVGSLLDLAPADVAALVAPDR